MITRTSQPASGAKLISEMKEFASFPKATQRYIRRSLDVAYGRRDAIECWARDEGEAASIRAQARLYKQLDHLRLQVPDDSGLDMIEPFIGMLITLAAFDLGQDRLPNFAAYRFLYERLIGAASRPWLPSAFCAAAALPHLHPDRRRTLLQSISESAATMSMAPPCHSETSDAPMTSLPGARRYTPVEYSRSKIMNTRSHDPSSPCRISGNVISREMRARLAPTVRAASSSSLLTCSSDDDTRRMP